MALADFIQEEVARQASEEALRSKVQAHIDRTIEDAVKSAFSFGDVSKQIRAAVDKSLALPSGLDVPEYGTMVLAVLRKKMDEILTPLVNERLATEMEQILGTGAREIKLSDLVEKMKETEDTSERFGSCCTCIVEDSSSSLTKGYLSIYLDPEDLEERTSYGSSKRGKHTATARIGVSPEGKIYSLIMNDKDAKTAVHMGTSWGWESRLFALYATGGKLIVDEDHVDRSYGDL